MIGDRQGRATILYNIEPVERLRVLVVHKSIVKREKRKARERVSGLPLAAFAFYRRSGHL